MTEENFADVATSSVANMQKDNMLYGFSLTTDLTI